MAYKDPEARRAYKRAYDLAHPDYQRAYNLAHPRDRREEHRAYRLAHRAERRAYYLAHRDQARASVRRWREKNLEKARELERHWRLVNVDARAAMKHRRRARKSGNGGSYTAAEWRETLALFAGLCAYCGAAGRMERDHKVPLARDGTNDIANIVPACRPCNLRKGQKTAEEFQRRVS